MAIDKSKLNIAFREMRARGLDAKQNFLCCGGCASEGLATRAKERRAARKPSKVGAAYYHGQDADDLREGRDLFIGFGGQDDLSDPPFDGDTLRVGGIVLASLHAAGLETEWDGSSSSRIRVIA